MRKKGRNADKARWKVEKVTRDEKKKKRLKKSIAAKAGNVVRMKKPARKNPLVKTIKTA